MTAVLAEYVGGELSHRQTLGVSRHLSGCQACAALVAEYRVVTHLARALPPLAPPPAAADRILTALRVAAGRPADETVVDIPLVLELGVGRSV